MTDNDPFTTDVIQASLVAIGEEMFAAMRKTAMSAIIYEVLDMGTAVTDAAGELASAGAGIPSFVGILDKAVKRVLEIHDLRTIRDGDLFITNDPYFGGVTHLNDVVLLLPVFDEGVLIAWTANIAHWNDVGGMIPGSMSTEAGEIYQEGLRLPAVKLFENGEPIASVMDILRANSRLPDFLVGDLWAGVAAARLGERRLKELVAKYGRAAFLDAMSRYMDYGEEQTLLGIRQLPKGRFSVAEEQDDGSVWRVAIEIRENKFIVDLRDNPDQSEGPYNSSREGVVVSAQILLRAITDPDAVTNGGSFRPLEVLTRPGSKFDATPPAAHGFYFETRARLLDLLCRCLADHLPERLPCGGFSSVCGTVIGGVHPDSGRHFTVVEPQIGGWGACRDRDGVNALFSGGHGETYNCPAEISEARHGMIVERLSLNPEPGGAGLHRGGRGIWLEYRIRSPEAFLTVGYSRSRVPPWGVAGGQDGSPNYVEIRRVDGSVDRHSFVSGAPLHENDVVRIVTGNGGGWGSPVERTAEDLARDARDELIGLDAGPA